MLQVKGNNLLFFKLHPPDML